MTLDPKRFEETPLAREPLEVLVVREFVKPGTGHIGPFRGRLPSQNRVSQDRVCPFSTGWPPMDAGRRSLHQLARLRL